MSNQNNPVLCIPRVYPNINEARIRKIFDELDMGVIDHIDIINVKPRSDKEEKMNRVFVHYREWNNSENANITKERLSSGKDIKIIYDDPWFWKVSAYREPKNYHNDKSNNDKSNNDKPQVFKSYRYKDSKQKSNEPKTNEIK